MQTAITVAKSGNPLTQIVATVNTLQARRAAIQTVLQANDEQMDALKDFVKLAPADRRQQALSVYDQAERLEAWFLALARDIESDGFAFLEQFADKDSEASDDDEVEVAVDA